MTMIMDIMAILKSGESRFRQFYGLKKLLGHKDVKTTQICSHMEADTLRGAVARLDRMKLVSNQ